MKVTVFPGQLTADTQYIPPSKSMAHRAIICASLAEGTSVLSNIDYSEDIRVTIQGMRQLGAEIIEDKDQLTICGISNFDSCQAEQIECNESGSSLRFFIPIFSLTKRKISFTGKNRLLHRPQSVYQTLFEKQGLKYVHTENSIEIEGSIQADEIELPGDISSQFISGLLFSLPLCSQTSRIRVQEPFESRSYVDLTLQMLNRFGIQAFYEDRNTLIIPGQQKYQSHNETIEGDYSQLGFFAALGVLNHSLNCLSLKHDSLQGDKELISILQNMGAHIEMIENGYRFHRGVLHGSCIDLANCPDLGPILMVLASYAQGTTTIINAGRLRYKESDRILAMETELRKLGVDISSTEDTVTIHGPVCWQGKQIVDGHKDHRIVMSLAVGATLANNSITIREAQSIRKSYPQFFEDLCHLGINVEVLDHE